MRLRRILRHSSQEALSSEMNASVTHLPNAKYCPDCRRLCPLEARACQGCGHRFRTRFSRSQPRRSGTRFIVQAWDAFRNNPVLLSATGWLGVIGVGLLLLLYPLGERRSTSTPVPRAAPHSGPGKPPAVSAAKLAPLSDKHLGRRPRMRSAARRKPMHRARRARGQGRQ